MGSDDLFFIYFLNKKCVSSSFHMRYSEYSLDYIELWVSMNI